MSWRRRGAGVGAAICIAAAGGVRAQTAEMLPPGVRSETGRALVEVDEAPYGERYVERIAPDAPPAIEYTPIPSLDAKVRDVLAEGDITLGHVVLMDPETGEIYAYVSTDARSFPATRPYPTASLMKVITAAAMLREKPTIAGQPCEWIGNPYVLREAHLADPATPDPAAEAAPEPHPAVAVVAEPEPHPAVDVVAEPEPLGEPTAEMLAAMGAAAVYLPPAKVTAEPLPAVDVAPPPGPKRAAAPGHRTNPLGEGGAGHAGPPSTPDLPETWAATFESALAISNNQCFARYAVRDLGDEALLAEMNRAAFAVAPAARHAPGRIDPIESEIDLANLGSGLAGSAITPLGAVRLAGALANGKLVAPQWIATRRDEETDIPVVPETPPAEPLWGDELTTTLRTHLRAVTETGTARRAFQHEDGTPRLGAIGVAGKTGSLRGDDPAGLYQWFIGVAPAEDPQLAIAAVVVHPDDAPADAERGVSASEIAAATLAEVFCDAGNDCAAERSAWLRERAPARGVEVARLQEIAVARAAEEAAAAARSRAKTFDAPLRPLDPPIVELPRSLRRHSRQGEVVLHVDLAPDGTVVSASVDSSDLPKRFGTFLVGEVEDWQFTPPRRGGEPVTGTVKLRVPIQVD